MNIFASSPCPVQSAVFLDNARVIKMILESTQMLNMAAVHFVNRSIGYKPTHKNHPCTQWVCENPNHFYWLLRHARALAKEYNTRYNKQHKCEQYFEFFQSVSNSIGVTGEPAYFVNCTANHKHIANVHEAYIACLQEKWAKDKNPSWKIKAVVVHS